MVALLVALTIIALVAADYFLLRPRRAATPDGEGGPLPGPAPLSATVARLPAGARLFELLPAPISGRKKDLLKGAEAQTVELLREAVVNCVSERARWRVGEHEELDDEL